MVYTLNFWDVLLEIEFYGVGYVIICVAITFVLAFTAPKSFRLACFRQPHYSKMEILLMETFPKRLFIAVPLTTLVVFPKLGRKRKLNKIYVVAPEWWKWISYGYVSLCLLPCMLWLFAAAVFVLAQKLG